MAPAPDLDALWARHHAGDDSARSELLAAYHGLVRSVAANEPDRSDLEKSDLESFGVFGLAEAIRTYDPERGMRSFEAYATYRIRYAVREAVRAANWVPKKVHQRTGAVARATSILEGRLGRHPTTEEIAAELDTTVEAVERTLFLKWRLNTKSSDAPVELGSRREKADAEPGEFAGPRSVHDRYGDTPESSFDAEEMRQRLSVAISSLSEQARVILALRYREGMEHAVLGATLGIGRTRACQLHTEAIEALRGALAGAHIDAFLGGQ